ncbi:MAG: GNAT family N-acetyltransferase [Chloroflexi bacterium]|nr:GNAT family N-acetyltransferase [Chloroflexota bacterium]
MHTHIAKTDAEIARCFPIMAQLLPNLREEKFVSHVQRLMKKGYALAYVKDEADICAVAGFRIVEMLSSSEPYLVVDEIVTDESKRSRGYGDALFEWLITYARQHSCRQIHLDSSVRFVEAHRFYFRQRMHIQGYHFVRPADE